MNAPWLSIIIPSLNEEKGITDTLAVLQEYRGDGVEIIICDASSSDNTVALATPLVDKVVYSPPGRAVQMNTGAAHSHGTSEVLWFLHADTIAPKDFYQELLVFRRSHRHWGAFDVSLNARGAMFRVIAFMINLRSYLSNICTGDQGIYLKRQTWKIIEGYDAIPLMEDVLLSKRLKALGSGMRIRKALLTSPRRWQKHGTWKTILLMWSLRWQFFRGADPQSLANRYN